MEFRSTDQTGLAASAATTTAVTNKTARLANKAKQLLNLTLKQKRHGGGIVPKDLEKENNDLSKLRGAMYTNNDEVSHTSRGTYC